MHALSLCPPELLQLAANEAERIEHNALEYLLASTEVVAWLDEYYAEVRHQSDAHAYAHMVRLVAGSFALGWSVAQLLTETLPVLSATTPAAIPHPN